MTGRQRGRLVEEEQFGITGAPHISVPPFEVQAATNPSARDPAASAQGALVAMEATAAIAEQQAARSIGEETAERIDAIGQRHWMASSENDFGARSTDISSGPNLAPRRAENHAIAAVHPPGCR
jgi:hypothetical protein